jgi:hypothetical protein
MIALLPGILSAQSLDPSSPAKEYVRALYPSDIAENS